MANLLRRVGRYVGAALGGKFEELADPKVQLEQAIADAQDQHRRLVEQAASVIANQRQTEMRLHRAAEELDRLEGSARQAVVMADEATRRGDTARSAELTRAAEAFANRMVATEKEVESLKSLHSQSSQAAEAAKRAVATNAGALQTKLTERQRLLSQLDQAKMQEQMNRAMTSLTASVGQDVPSLGQVRDKIEARYAQALGHAELEGQTVEARMLEVEQAQVDSEAQARLANIRTQLGLGPGPGDSPGQPIPSVEEGPARPSS